MKMLKLLMLLVIITSFGCSATPKRYQSTLIVKGEINYKETQDIINSALIETFPGEYIDGTCLIYNRGHQYQNNEFAKVCYSVSGYLTNRVPFINRGHSTINDWIEKISTKQANFEANYTSLANNYIMTKQRNLDTFNSKVKDVQKECIDYTHSLPQNIVDSLCNQITILKDYPNIITRYPKYVHKYVLKTKSNVNYSTNFKNYPDTLISQITDYNVVPIPDFFSLEDTTLIFKTHYWDIHGLAYGKLNSIELSNKSTDFITIKNITGYYKGTIVNNILPDSITIPLRTKTTIGVKYMNSFPSQSKPYQFVSHGDKAEYGFAIKYQKGGSKTVATLYDVKEFIAK